MSMNKSSTATSMKTLLFVLGMAMLVFSAQFGVGECRALRSMAACEQEGSGGGSDGGDQSVGMASTFVVSANNSSSNGPLARSLTFMLASGPSKKGPGH
jgi:hypothetical protein